MVKIIGISGGTGFCGQEIVKRAIQKGIKVVSYQRAWEEKCDYTVREFNLENVSQIDSSFFEGVDTFVHTAALVHRKEKNTTYQTVNFLATKILFQKCAEAGVKKFIFLSTVGVYGLSSALKSVNIGSKLAPKTPYSKSKLDAENYLIESSFSYGLDVLILRLPLVYGEGAPGNLGLLKKVTNWQIPLPFKGVKNRRSVISVENLANSITDCALGELNWTGIELIAEPRPLSTESIISKINQGKSRPVIFFSVPKKILKPIFLFVGAKSVYEKLFEDLVFESSQSVSDFADE